MLSPMQLLSARLESLAIDVNPNFEAGGQKPAAFAIAHHCELAHNEDRSQCMVLLRVDCKPKARTTKNHAFKRVSAVVRGFFALPAEIPEETAQNVVPLSCMAVLYGIARGFVAQATALAPGGPVFLPLMDLSDLTPAQDKKPSKRRARGKRMALAAKTAAPAVRRTARK